MLILSRKMNEQIIIGDNIRITVVGISGGHVRLGIEAPREVPIHREEVVRATKEAAGTSAAGVSRRPVPVDEPVPEHPFSPTGVTVGAHGMIPESPGTLTGH